MIELYVAPTIHADRRARLEAAARDRRIRLDAKQATMRCTRLRRLLAVVWRGSARRPTPCANVAPAPA